MESSKGALPMERGTKMTVKQFIFFANSDIKFSFSFIKGEYTKDELLAKENKIFWCSILDHVVTRYWALDINRIHIDC